MRNYYSQEEHDLFQQYENKIVFSKNFRRLHGKTQLFSSKKGDHFRNRMVHTEEVRSIAINIANRINKELSENLIDINLLSCIALAHDFGHTPFGHVGERTLQSIMSGNDDLGGLLHTKDLKKQFFKHNINSMRLLIDEFSANIPWQILDGVLKHSKLNYSDKESFNVSYMLSKTNYDKIYFDNKNSSNPLTLEGQIVAIADEIAQRYSDFEDTFRAKNINALKRILDDIDSKIYCEDDCKKYIDSILRSLINNVVKQSVININKVVLTEQNDIISYLSKNKVIDYDEIGQDIDNKISEFIKDCIFDIDELRQEDEKNKHIIRQLFKAYYNNCAQIKGSYFHEFVVSLNEYKNKLKASSYSTDIDDIFLKIFEYNIYDNLSKKIDKDNLFALISKLKYAVTLRNVPEQVANLYSKYLELICYYIASMTDQYASDSYQYLYGLKGKNN